MSARCRGPAWIDAEADEGGLEWRTVAASIAAAAWGAGVAAAAVGLDVAGSGAFVIAVVVGGSTFAPDALLGLRRGHLGVSLLMTVAATGALLLGQLAEAAA